MIAKPIARFVRIIDSDPTLGNKYGERANTYELAIKDALQFHEDVEKSLHIYTYQVDGKIYAYPRFCVGCDETETDPKRSGIMAPLNFIAVLGSVYGELAHRSPYYSDRALYLARTVKDLIARTAATSTWAYWPAYDLNDVDDVSHGALVADFAALAVSRGIEFTSGDLQSIADNFVARVTLYENGTPVHLATDIDGVVYAGKYMDAACGMWMRLADFNGRVRAICADICGWDSDTLSCRNDAHSYDRAEAQLFRLH